MLYIYVGYWNEKHDTQHVVYTVIYLINILFYFVYKTCVEIYNKCIFIVIIKVLSFVFIYH